MKKMTYAGNGCASYDLFHLLKYTPNASAMVKEVVEAIQVTLNDQKLIPEFVSG